MQIQEDLEQEKEDNKQNPEEKKEALKAIIADYNLQYGTNHSVNEFDLYYQDVQKRIKDQKYPNKDYPRQNKIDLTIVVDMLLTGFDSPYLNTLYVDKNLKYHGLIQAFSRTNRVLNDTKPYGNILDFRSQQEAVNQAIALFAGQDSEKALTIWIVEPAPAIIEKYQKAVEALAAALPEYNLLQDPQKAYDLKGDAQRIAFINKFKEAQRIKTQLDQYTDLTEEQKAQIQTILPQEKLQELRSAYLEIALRLRNIQQKEGEQAPPQIQQLDFEFVLFASAVIDYDYIMNLIANQSKPGKQKMARAQVISLLSSSANLIEEKEDLTEYIHSLDWNAGHNINALHKGYQRFKEEKNEKQIAAIAYKHQIPLPELKAFVEATLSRMIFDGEKLTDLLQPLGLSWKQRVAKERALMQDLAPQLKKLAQGAEISGLAAYEA